MITRRSSRSLPTGPGSRGGSWHDPGYRRAYFRAWRAAHPEYREREVARSASRKRTWRLARDRREVDALVFPADIGYLGHLSP